MSGGASVLLVGVTGKVFSVDTGSFLAIVVTAAVAGTVAAVAGGRGLFLPVVVLELVLGVVIGPQGLGIAQVNGFTGFFSDLGLGMLFFFAGYEIDIPRIRGRPLTLALFGWAMSLAIAYGLGGVLAAAGVVVSLVYVGSALATTAIGTLLPVLSDTGELDTEFGTYLLAAGAVGEFGPVLLLTLVLSTQSPAHSAVILVAFVALAVAVAVVAVRSSGRTMPLFERTIEKSSQLAVRWIVVLVFALALLASDLGLDLLLGGFAAGSDHEAGPAQTRGAWLRLEADRDRVRRVHSVLLCRQRHAPGRRRAVLECVERWKDAAVLRAVPGRSRHAGAVALSRRVAPEGGPHGARAVHRHTVAARRRDHDRRRPGRSHAFVDRCRARRRRGAFDPRRTAPRDAHAPGRRAQTLARESCGSKRGGSRRAEPRVSRGPDAASL